MFQSDADYRWGCESGKLYTYFIPYHLIVGTEALNNNQLSNPISISEPLFRATVLYNTVNLSITFAAGYENSHDSAMYFYITLTAL